MEPLYLWIAWHSGVLQCYTIEEYTIRNNKYYTFSIGNRAKTIPLEDLEKFKYDRVLSKSNDYNYIKNIVSKELFKKMLKAQEEYNERNLRFTRFREING